MFSSFLVLISCHFIRHFVSVLFLWKYSFLFLLSSLDISMFSVFLRRYGWRLCIASWLCIAKLSLHILLIWCGINGGLRYVACVFFRYRRDIVSMPGVNLMLICHMACVRCWARALISDSGVMAFSVPFSAAYHFMIILIVISAIGYFILCNLFDMARPLSEKTHIQSYLTCGVCEIFDKSRRSDSCSAARLARLGVSGTAVEASNKYLGYKANNSSASL
jgi:hypothetical protein